MCTPTSSEQLTTRDPIRHVRPCAAPFGRAASRRRRRTARSRPSCLRFSPSPDFTLHFIPATFELCTPSLPVAAACKRLAASGGCRMATYRRLYCWACRRQGIERPAFCWS